MSDGVWYCKKCGRFVGSSWGSTSRECECGRDMDWASCRTQAKCAMSVVEAKDIYDVAKRVQVTKFPAFLLDNKNNVVDGSDHSMEVTAHPVQATEFDDFEQAKEFFKDKDIVILENDLYPEVPEGKILARYYEIASNEEGQSCCDDPDLSSMT